MAGRSFAAVREIGVRTFDPILYRTRCWRCRNPWLNLLSALIEFFVAFLMLPLESVYLMGFLLEKADEKLRVAGNSYIDRWAVRYKGTAESC